MTETKSQTGLSVIEAARLVGRRTETIYRAIANQRIKAAQNNGEWLIDKKSLLAYVSSPRSRAIAERARGPRGQANRISPAESKQS